MCVWGGSGVCSFLGMELQLTASGVPWRQEDTTWPQQGTATSAAGGERKVCVSHTKGE